MLTMEKVKCWVCWGKGRMAGSCRLCPNPHCPHRDEAKRRETIAAQREKRK